METEAVSVKVPPRDTDGLPERPVKEVVKEELARSVFSTVAQVATPEPLRERTNWLVHDVPPYGESEPAVERANPVPTEENVGTPFALMENTEAEDVANVVGDEVAR